MKKQIFSILLMLCILQFSASLCQAQAPVQKSNLKVLYVGGSGNRDSYLTPEEKQADVKRRIASFNSMLNNYFAKVTVMDADDYTKELSDNYDVTVMDGVPGQSTSTKDFKRRYSVFSEDFTRPVLFIAETSPAIGEGIGLKFDAYCLCLAGDAFNIRTNHPIFKGPFQVKITTVIKPVPGAARALDYKGKLPDNIPTWTVQTESYQDGGRLRAGMISHEGGFEDSPDAEYISGGSSAKDINAVAIGRHGSFFHWGFAASPEFLTPEAKVVLANAIIYISKFNGKRVIARKYDQRIKTTLDMEVSRDIATEQGLKGINAYDVWVNSQIIDQKNKILAKKGKGEKLTEEEEEQLNSPTAQLWEAKLRDPTSLQSLLKSSQGALFAKFGTNLKAYKEYYNSNMGYFYGGKKYELTVDEDLKTLKIKHNDPKLLSVAIGMLEKGKDADMAKRILDRYTLATYDTPEQWRSWYEKNKDKFFFSESGGYYFLINSNEKGVEGNDYKKKQKKVAYNKINTGVTDDTNPVSVAVAAIPSAAGSKEIVIKFSVHPGYHIYGYVSKKDPFIKTEVKIELPAGYKALTALKAPTGTVFNANSTTVYNDEAIFTQEISGTGTGEVLCNITYQCCNDNICLPPVDAQYKIKI